MIQNFNNIFLVVSWYLKYWWCIMQYMVMGVEKSVWCDMVFKWLSDDGTQPLPCVSGGKPKSMQWYSHSLACSSEGAPLCSEERLWCSLLSVVAPQHNNCSAFLCFPYLPPLSRLKATDFVWLYKMGWDMDSSQCFFGWCFCLVLLCSS